MYDVVWYTPDRIADVDKVLARLSPEECISRAVPGDLIMSQPGITLPLQGTQGRAVCRHFMGANELPLGNTRAMESICVMSEHGSGLIGGMLKAEFLLSEEMEAAEARAAEREAMLRAQIPWRFGQCTRYVWLSMLGVLAGLVMCVRAIPRALRPEPKKRIRSVSELEREYAKVAACGIIKTRGH